MKDDVTELQEYHRDVQTESESRISRCYCCGKEITFGRIFCKNCDTPLNKQIFEFFSEFPKNRAGDLIRPRGEKLYQVIKYYLAARMGISNDKKIVLKSISGAGKSLLIDMIAFIEITHFPNSLTIIGSVAEKVSQEHIIRLREWISNSIFRRYMEGTHEATASKTEIKLAKLNSRVLSMPQSERTRTGWHPSLLLVDEVARMRKDAFYGCYDDETEILTENGWLSLMSIVEHERKIKVATLNSESNEVEYHYPSDYFRYRYMGELIHHTSKNIDLNVTPNHNMWISTSTSHPNWQFKKAYQLSNKSIRYRRDFPYKGEEREFIKIGEHDFKIDDWLGFLGIYLAEGWVQKNANITKISATYFLEEVENLIKKLDLRYRYDERDRRFLIYDKSLKEYLFALGKSHFKYIPRDVLQLSKSHLKILFDAMYLGDGRKAVCEGYYVYTTVSKQLADDVHEIILKIGLSGQITERKDKSAFDVLAIDNKSVVKCNTKTSSLKTEAYDGYVYCLSVPNNLLYTRRSGKSCWSGNSFFQMGRTTGVIQIACSTPFLDSLVMQDMWNDDDMIKIALEPEDCWWIPKEVFRDAKNMPSELYEQLFQAKFRSVSNRVIPDDLLLQAMQRGEHYPSSKNFVMGVDFGRSIDPTAIVVLDIETGDVKFVETFNDEWQIQFQKIRKLYKDWNPIRIVADKSSIGDVIISDLQDLPIQGVSIHNDILKKQLVDKLVMAFYNYKINIVNEEFPKLVTELSNFVYYDSEHSKVGPIGRGHDDCVDSLALCLKAMDVSSVRDGALPDNLWSFTRVGERSSSDPWRISNV